LSLELIAKGLAELDESTATLNRLMGLVESHIAKRREEDAEKTIIANYVIPLVEPADKVNALQTQAEMTTEQHPDVTSISALEYELHESKMLLNMVQAGRERLLEKKAFWEQFEPAKMPPNDKPTTGREMLAKAGMDWEDTMRLVASMVPAVEVDWNDLVAAAAKDDSKDDSKDD
jgi:hypothetical protein